MSLDAQSEGAPRIAESQPASPPLSAQRVSLLDEAHARYESQRAWQSEPIVALLVAAVALALLNFLSNAPVLNWLLAPDESTIASEWTSAYWVGCRVLCYFLIPMGTTLALGRNPLDFGLRVRGVGRHLPMYMALLLVMAPIVVAVSFTTAFHRYYPFYDYAGESLRGFLWWESLYALQFITLEFFYRGYLLFSLERYIGVYSVFVMVIPYTMVHFGKPFAETLAAIPAGVILGLLALRSRSIWPARRYTSASAGRWTCCRYGSEDRLPINKKGGRRIVAPPARFVLEGRRPSLAISGSERLAFEGMLGIRAVQLHHLVIQAENEERRHPLADKVAHLFFTGTLQAER